MTNPGPHRQAFAAALGQLHVRLGDLAGEAGRVLADANVALLDPAQAPDRFATARTTVAALHQRVEDLDTDLVNLLALQAPMAGDLRLVTAALRIAVLLGRMGTLAEHIAESADRRAPHPLVPEPLRPQVAELGKRCEAVTDRLTDALRADDPAAAAQVEAADDRVDDIHRWLLRELTDPAWPHGVQAAVDLTLVSRYYERFADQAVSVARRLAGIHAGEPR